MIASAYRNTESHPCRLFSFRQGKVSTKINFLGSGARLVGWGSFTRRGGGRKVRALPRKFVFPGFRREDSTFSPPSTFRRFEPPLYLRGFQKRLCKKSALVDVLDIFYFFPLGGGEGGVRGVGGGGWFVFFIIENPRKGGVSSKGGRWGPGGCLQGIRGGGGLNVFFRGRNSRQGSCAFFVPYSWRAKMQQLTSVHRDRHFNLMPPSSARASRWQHGTAIPPF